MGHGDRVDRTDDEFGARPADQGRNAAMADRAEARRGRHERPEEAATGPTSLAQAQSRSSGVGPALLGLLVGLALGISGSLLLDDDGGSGAADPFAGHIDSSSYQAVILANDRVYFGQIRSANDEFYRLEDAFFLRESRADEAAEPVRVLLPVNREFHGPENEMLIARTEVVLVEDLAPDSPILEEIERQLGQFDTGG